MRPIEQIKREALVQYRRYGVCAETKFVCDALALLAVVEASDYLNDVADAIAQQGGTHHPYTIDKLREAIAAFKKARTGG